jgi:hypothetical protein
MPSLSPVAWDCVSYGLTLYVLFRTTSQIGCRGAGKMGDIYMHSYCTIAAHAAQHADHGFLEQALATPRMVQIGQFRITQGSNKKLHIEESDLSSRG